MSNSVVFLLIAVGLSAFGSLIVWLHGRPRRIRSSVDHFHRGLRALSADSDHTVTQSGVTLRRNDGDDEPPVEPEQPQEAPVARTPRPSPRPSPRPVARTRPQPSEREGSRPGS
jgi:hypothetical protein